MKDNGKESWYYKIIKLLHLETITPHGRVNLGGIGLLTACILIYSASDTIKHLISAAEDTIKTWALGTDVYHPYETSNVFIASLPVLIGLGLCLFYLYLHEKKKDQILEKEKSDNNT